MITTILIGIAVAIAVVLILAAMRPTECRVTRSLAIQASPSDLFMQANDFRKWMTWSPFEKLDPAMQRTLGGPRTGPGSTYEWSGNKRAGAGRATILESRTDELTRWKLEFFRPFACVSTAEFSFRAEGDRTVVTWTLTGENNFFARLMSLFINMDKMIGRDFEAGLAKLKDLTETAPVAQT
jgi:hypothetical protein